MIHQLKILFGLHFLFFSCAIPYTGWAQHEEIEEATELKNVVVVSFGYTHIPAGSSLESETKDGFFVPTLGLE